ncbi:hypothetical protein SRHO_G00022790 [Serrasalmus rhombeus]
MAHAAAHIKKARVEMEQQQLPDLKALEKARERRKRSRERAERRRKVRGNKKNSFDPCHPAIVKGRVSLCFCAMSTTAAIDMFMHAQAVKGLPCLPPSLSSPLPNFITYHAVFVLC